MKHIACIAAAAFAAATGMATYEAPLAVRGTVEAKLTAGPTVTKVRPAVKISFAVSAASDVEVAVLDKTGKVVRHLAAGLLGKHAPAPFQPGSLSQTVTWNGKDDADSAGPKSTVPEPEIAFAWPTEVDYSEFDGKLYVTDSVNLRVMVIRFDYADSREVEVN